MRVVVSKLPLRCKREDLKPIYAKGKDLKALPGGPLLINIKARH